MKNPLSFVALAVFALLGAAFSASRALAPPAFHEVATFKVSGKVAEIVDATPDAKTLIYTDSARREIGFVDISVPEKPRQIATLNVGGEPTSVSIAPNGKIALVCVHGAPDKLLAISLATRRVLASWKLRAQPDSTAISHDGRFAAIVIEAERRDFKKPIPQAPAGSVVILEMRGAAKNWKLKDVALTNLPLRFPTDPEPEYVSFNARNQVAVTLQENNGIAIIDAASARVVRAFSLGNVTHAADTKNDGKISFTDKIVNAPREPDHLKWTPRGNLITANEGDYDFGLKPNQFAGGRGFSIFSPTGKLIYDSAAALEMEVAQAGLYDDKRSDVRGIEPEGIGVGTFGGRALAFIGCERARCVLVCDLSNERTPRILQVLKTGKKPEGILALPQRNLLVTANEGDGTLSIFRCGTR